MGNVKQFDLKGIYPGNGFRNRFLASVPLYDQLSAVFQSAIDYHFEFGGIHDKQKKTVWTEARAAMNFYKHLQNCGTETFHEVENRMVYTFFCHGEEQIRGKDYCSLVKSALKTAVQLYGEPAQKILEMLPVIKAGNKNFPQWEEVHMTQMEVVNVDVQVNHLARKSKHFKICRP